MGVVITKEFRIKTYEEHRIHFIERLKERYGLEIGEEDYDEICSHPYYFNGVIKKSGSKSVGWIYILGRKVWVLYSNDDKWYSTCLPSEIEWNIQEMITACFSPNIREIARMVYREYEKEAKLVAARGIPPGNIFQWLYTNTLFSLWHIEKFKYGKIRSYKIIKDIQRILSGESEKIQLTIKRKQ